MEHARLTEPGVSYFLEETKPYGILAISEEIEKSLKIYS